MRLGRVRVAASAALMTDVYPPFGLDRGGTEPAEPATDGEALAASEDHSLGAEQ